MEHALKSVPVTDIPVPPGVINVGGEWFYEEFARGNGVSSLGVDAQASEATPTSPATEERRSILNLFRQ